jgi:hypothetical protein
LEKVLNVVKKMHFKISIPKLVTRKTGESSGSLLDFAIYKGKIKKVAVSQAPVVCSDHHVLTFKVSFDYHSPLKFQYGRELIPDKA